MVKHCQNCGVFLSATKPGVIIIDVGEDFRKNRPDIAAHVYLCTKEECSKKLEEYKTYHWYAGHKIVS